MCAGYTRLFTLLGKTTGYTQVRVILVRVLYALIYGTLHVTGLVTESPLWLSLDVVGGGYLR